MELGHSLCVHENTAAQMGYRLVDLELRRGWVPPIEVRSSNHSPREQRSQTFRSVLSAAGSSAALTEDV